ncbi:MAG: FecR domain-containing protein [Ferruginibacter sp.]
MENNYTDYEDLIADESFAAWVFKTNALDVDKWERWIKENPDKEHLANEAANVLQHIRINNEPLSHVTLDAAEIRLRSSMAEGKKATVIPFSNKKIWYAAAAVLLVSLAFGLNFLFNPGGKEKIATAYGQIKKNQLYDGTEVVLNANSTLTYGKNWQEGKDREVWLKGEAFFHVKKKPKHDKFIVHTDAFDIEVTGTSFNVINLNGKSSIILKEGSVKIHRPGIADILMKPGDLVEFNNQQIQRKIIIKQDYLAWMENKLVFDNTPIADVAALIKNHYGVEIKLSGNNISSQTITGIMPNDNLDVLLQALDATQELHITHANDIITITSNNQ